MFKIIIGNINDPLLPRILFFFLGGEKLIYIGMSYKSPRVITNIQRNSNYTLNGV